MKRKDIPGDPPESKDSPWKGKLMQYNITDKGAHHFSSHNRISGVQKSQQCGCFCCCEIFSATEVVEYCDQAVHNSTALCPRCGIDSVLPDAWIELSEELLTELSTRWFGTEAAP
ncbi:hypothetical protein LCGC14_0698880 [marine sediment metagenome]|uniref:Cytoplasmic protein n=1 Tax=marine sediment metagenome TaxID=412755 RepID=A0A0F9QN74_9ZZZZ